MSLGIPEEQLREIAKTVNLDGYGSVIACVLDHTEDGIDMGWDWEGP